MSQRVRDCVESIRSKNAGPYWITIDIFCGSDVAFSTIVKSLATAQLAKVLQQSEATIKRFEIESLNVVKFSLPRPVVQGHHTDRDLHGAQWAVLIGDIVL